MFDKWISETVLAVLRLFIDIEWERLCVTWWSGFTLEDVHIRQDLMAALELPLELVEGRISRVHVSGDWSLARPLQLRPKLSVEGATIVLRTHIHGVAGYGGRYSEESERQPSTTFMSTSALRRPTTALVMQLLKHVCINIADVSVAFVDHDCDDELWDSVSTREVPRPRIVRASSMGLVLSRLSTDAGTTLPPPLPAEAKGKQMSRSEIPTPDSAVVRRLDVVVDGVFWVPRRYARSRKVGVLEITRLEDAQEWTLLEQTTVQVTIRASDSVREKGALVRAHAMVSAVRARVTPWQLADATAVFDSLGTAGVRMRYGHLRPAGMNALLCSRRTCQPASRNLRIAQYSKQGADTCDAAVTTATWSSVWRYAVLAVRTDLRAPLLRDARSHRAARFQRRYSSYIAAVAILYAAQASTQGDKAAAAGAPGSRYQKMWTGNDIDAHFFTWLAEACAEQQAQAAQPTVGQPAPSASDPQGWTLGEEDPKGSSATEDVAIVDHILFALQPEAHLSLTRPTSSTPKLQTSQLLSWSFELGSRSATAAAEDVEPESPCIEHLQSTFDAGSPACAEDVAGGSSGGGTGSTGFHEVDSRGLPVDEDYASEEGAASGSSPSCTAQYNAVHAVEAVSPSLTLLDAVKVAAGASVWIVVDDLPHLHNAARALSRRLQETEATSAVAPVADFGSAGASLATTSSPAPVISVTFTAEAQELTLSLLDESLPWDKDASASLQGVTHWKRDQRIKLREQPRPALQAADASQEGPGGDAELLGDAESDTGSIYGSVATGTEASFASVASPSLSSDLASSAESGLPIARAPVDVFARAERGDMHADGAQASQESTLEASSFKSCASALSAATFKSCTSSLSPATSLRQSQLGSVQHSAEAPFEVPPISDPLAHGAAWRSGATESVDTTAELAAPLASQEPSRDLRTDRVLVLCVLGTRLSADLSSDPDSLTVQSVALYQLRQLPPAADAVGSPSSGQGFVTALQAQAGIALLLPKRHVAVAQQRALAMPPRAASMSLSRSRTSPQALFQLRSVDLTAGPAPGSRSASIDAALASGHSRPASPSHRMSQALRAAQPSPLLTARLVPECHVIDVQALEARLEPAILQFAVRIASVFDSEVPALLPRRLSGPAARLTAAADSMVHWTPEQPVRITLADVTVQVPASLLDPDGPGSAADAHSRDEKGTLARLDLQGAEVHLRSCVSPVDLAEALHDARIMQARAVGGWEAGSGPSRPGSPVQLADAFWKLPIAGLRSPKGAHSGLVSNTLSVLHLDVDSLSACMLPTDLTVNALSSDASAAAWRAGESRSGVELRGASVLTAYAPRGGAPISTCARLTALDGNVRWQDIERIETLAGSLKKLLETPSSNVEPPQTADDTPEADQLKAEETAVNTYVYAEIDHTSVTLSRDEFISGTALVLTSGAFTAHFADFPHPATHPPIDASVTDASRDLHRATAHRFAGAEPEVVRNAATDCDLYARAAQLHDHAARCMEVAVVSQSMEITCHGPGGPAHVLPFLTYVPLTTRRSASDKLSVAMLMSNAAAQSSLTWLDVTVLGLYLQTDAPELSRRSSLRQSLSHPYVFDSERTSSLPNIPGNASLAHDGSVHLDYARASSQLPQSASANYLAPRPTERPLQTSHGIDSRRSSAQPTVLTLMDPPQRTDLVAIVAPSEGEVGRVCFAMAAAARTKTKFHTCVVIEGMSISSALGTHLAALFTPSSNAGSDDKSEPSSPNAEQDDQAGARPSESRSIDASSVTDSCDPGTQEAATTAVSAIEDDPFTTFALRVAKSRLVSLPNHLPTMPLRQDNSSQEPDFVLAFDSITGFFPEGVPLQAACNDPHVIARVQASWTQRALIGAHAYEGRQKVLDLLAVQGLELFLHAPGLRRFDTGDSTPEPYRYSLARLHHLKVAATAALPHARPYALELTCGSGVHLEASCAKIECISRAVACTKEAYNRALAALRRANELFESAGRQSGGAQASGGDSEMQVALEIARASIMLGDEALASSSEMSSVPALAPAPGVALYAAAARFMHAASKQLPAYATVRLAASGVALAGGESNAAGMDDTVKGVTSCRADIAGVALRVAVQPVKQQRSPCSQPAAMQESSKRLQRWVTAQSTSLEDGAAAVDGSGVDEREVLKVDIEADLGPTTIRTGAAYSSSHPQGCALHPTDAMDAAACLVEAVCLSSFRPSKPLSPDLYAASELTQTSACPVTIRLQGTLSRSSDPARATGTISACIDPVMAMVDTQALPIAVQVVSDAASAAASVTHPAPQHGTVSSLTPQLAATPDEGGHTQGIVQLTSTSDVDTIQRDAAPAPIRFQLRDVPFCMALTRSEDEASTTASSANSARSGNDNSVRPQSGNTDSSHASQMRYGPVLLLEGRLQGSMAASPASSTATLLLPAARCALAAAQRRGDDAVALLSDRNVATVRTLQLCADLSDAPVDGDHSSGGDDDQPSKLRIAADQRGAAFALCDSDAQDIAFILAAILAPATSDLKKRGEDQLRARGPQGNVESPALVLSTLASRALTGADVARVQVAIGVRCALICVDVVQLSTDHSSSQRSGAKMAAVVMPMVRLRLHGGGENEVLASLVQSSAAIRVYASATLGLETFNPVCQDWDVVLPASLASCSALFQPAWAADPAVAPTSTAAPSNASAAQQRSSHTDVALSLPESLELTVSEHVMRAVSATVLALAPAAQPATGPASPKQSSRPLSAHKRIPSTAHVVHPCLSGRRLAVPMRVVNTTGLQAVLRVVRLPRFPMRPASKLPIQQVADAAQRSSESTGALPGTIGGAATSTHTDTGCELHELSTAITFEELFWQSAAASELHGPSDPRTEFIDPCDFGLRVSVLDPRAGAPREPLVSFGPLRLWPLLHNVRANGDVQLLSEGRPSKVRLLLTARRDADSKLLEVRLHTNVRLANDLDLPVAMRARAVDGQQNPSSRQSNPLTLLPGATQHAPALMVAAGGFCVRPIREASIAEPPAQEPVWSRPILLSSVRHPDREEASKKDTEPRGPSQIVSCGVRAQNGPPADAYCMQTRQACLCRATGLRGTAKSLAACRCSTPCLETTISLSHPFTVVNALPLPAYVIIDGTRVEAAACSAAGACCATALPWSTIHLGMDSCALVTVPDLVVDRPTVVEVPALDGGAAHFVTVRLTQSGLASTLLVFADVCVFNLMPLRLRLTAAAAGTRNVGSGHGGRKGSTTSPSFMHARHAASSAIIAGPSTASGQAPVKTQDAESTSAAALVSLLSTSEHGAADHDEASLSAHARTPGVALGKRLSGTMEPLRRLSRRHSFPDLELSEPGAIRNSVRDDQALPLDHDDDDRTDGAHAPARESHTSGFGYHLGNSRRFVRAEHAANATSVMAPAFTPASELLPEGMPFASRRHTGGRHAAPAHRGFRGLTGAAAAPVRASYACERHANDMRTSDGDTGLWTVPRSDTDDEFDRPWATMPLLLSVPRNTHASTSQSIAAYLHVAREGDGTAFTEMPHSDAKLLQLERHTIDIPDGASSTEASSATGKVALPLAPGSPHWIGASVRAISHPLTAAVPAAATPEALRGLRTCTVVLAPAHVIINRMPQTVTAEAVLASGVVANTTQTLQADAASCVLAALREEGPGSSEADGKQGMEMRVSVADRDCRRRATIPSELGPPRAFELTAKTAAPALATYSNRQQTALALQLGSLTASADVTVTTLEPLLEDSADVHIQNLTAYDVRAYQKLSTPRSDASPHPDAVQNRDHTIPSYVRRPFVWTQRNASSPVLCINFAIGLTLEIPVQATEGWPVHVSDWLPPSDMSNGHLPGPSHFHDMFSRRRQASTEAAKRGTATILADGALGYDARKLASLLCVHVERSARHVTVVVYTHDVHDPHHFEVAAPEAEDRPRVTSQLRLKVDVGAAFMSVVHARSAVEVLLAGVEGASAEMLLDDTWQASVNARVKTVRVMNSLMDADVINVIGMPVRASDTRQGWEIDTSKPALSIGLEATLAARGTNRVHRCHIEVAHAAVQLDGSILRASYGVAAEVQALLAPHLNPGVPPRSPSDSPGPSPLWSGTDALLALPPLDALERPPSAHLTLKAVSVSALALTFTFVAPRHVGADPVAQVEDDEDVPDDANMPQRVKTWLRVLLTAASISGAEISVGAWSTDSAQKSAPALMEEYVEHITNAALPNMLWVLGSMDILGSPAQLIRELFGLLRGIYAAYNSVATAITSGVRNQDGSAASMADALGLALPNAPLERVVTLATALMASFARIAWRSVMTVVMSANKSSATMRGIIGASLPEPYTPCANLLAAVSTLPHLALACFAACLRKSSPLLLPVNTVAAAFKILWGTLAQPITFALLCTQFASNQMLNVLQSRIENPPLRLSRPISRASPLRPYNMLLARGARALQAVSAGLHRSSNYEATPPNAALRAKRQHLLGAFDVASYSVVKAMDSFGDEADAAADAAHAPAAHTRSLMSTVFGSPARVSCRRLLVVTGGALSVLSEADNDDRDVQLLLRIPLAALLSARVGDPGVLMLTVWLPAGVAQLCAESALVQLEASESASVRDGSVLVGDSAGERVASSPSTFLPICKVTVRCSNERDALEAQHHLAVLLASRQGSPRLNITAAAW